PDSGEPSIAPILQLPGTEAWSGFRLERKLEALRRAVPRITALHSGYHYFIHCSEKLSATEQAHLADLLPGANTGRDLEEPHFFVVPREGTISPWSSKATDIAHA